MLLFACAAASPSTSVHFLTACVAISMRAQPRSRRRALLLLLACSHAAATRHNLCVYRSPSGAAAKEWAVSKASAFRELDVASFAPNGLWNEKQYIRELTNPRSEIYCVWEKEVLRAFVCTERVLEDAHMLSLAVHPSYRRHGLAKMLVVSSLLAARAAGQRSLTLEVRASNTAALALYRSCGFGLVGQRPKYYRSPPEEAKLLTRSFEEDKRSIEFLDEYHEPPEQLEALTQACGPLAEPLIQHLADARAAEVADGVRVHNYDPGALGVLVGEMALYA